MNKARRSILLLGALIALAACSSNATSGTKSSTVASPTAPKCSIETAKETREFEVARLGFTVTCAKVAKGAEVFFINGGDKLAKVSLTKSGADDFNAELPNKTSTYTHTFKSAGTYLVSSTADSTLTLFVTG